MGVSAERRQTSRAPPMGPTTRYPLDQMGERYSFAAVYANHINITQET